MNMLCVVLVAPGDEASFRRVREVLRPYDARLPVELFEEECWCVGAQACADAEEAADEEFVNGADGERYLWALHVQKDDPDNDFTAEEKAEIKEIEARREAIRVRHEEAHPLYNKPSPNCEDCGGSGEVERWGNPIATIDEWQPAQRFGGKFRVPVRELLRDLDKYEVWAVVTPRGTWYERESPKHKDRETPEGYERRDAPLRERWERELKAILEANEDSTAMSVVYMPYHSPMTILYLPYRL